MENFNILYMTEEQAPSKFMIDFYNKEGRKKGFNGVYTKEGYYLAHKISNGRGWHKWFTEMRGKDATNYKQKLSYFAEDGATVIDCDIVATGVDGKQVGRTRLTSTYIGGSSTNHDEDAEEWKKGLQASFNEVLEDVKTFLTWKDWEQGKGL